MNDLVELRFSIPSSRLQSAVDGFKPTSIQLGNPPTRHVSKPCTVIENDYFRVARRAAHPEFRLE
jgi:hypothetical protein